MAAELVVRDGWAILGGMLFEPEELNPMTAFMKTVGMQFVVQYSSAHFHYAATMLAERGIDISLLASAEIPLTWRLVLMQTLSSRNKLCKVLVALWRLLAELN